MSAECGCDQIAAKKHLAGHLGITRLVWAKQWKMAQTVQIKRDDYEEKEKTAALGKRRRLQV
jgi:hypothetical protein